MGYLHRHNATKERINEFEERVTEFAQTDTQKYNRKKKYIGKLNLAIRIIHYTE